MIKYYIVGIVVLILIIAFAVKNVEVVRVDLLVTKANLKLIVVILVSFVLGSIAGLVMMLQNRWRLGKEIKGYQARIKELEGRLAPLVEGEKEGIEGEVKEGESSEGI